jgi:tetratricopeptide (TPR) repeat protein
VKAAVRGIYRLENAVTNDAARPKFVTLDVVEMTADELKKKFLACGDLESAHLWMPGEISWVVVCHKPGATVSLAKAMDAVADDPSCTVSVPEVFASYVGTLAEVMPAFDSKLEGNVVPEWFVPEVVAAIPWIDGTGVDGDILKSVSDEVRSMRNVRREVLKGNMAARAAKDKKGEEAACEIWAKAALRNPNDTLLLERIETLERNAKGFLEVGRPLQAMKCFETIILIQPKHASAVHNFGLCLQKLGKRDLADQVLKRAETLRQAAEADAAK